MRTPGMGHSALFPGQGSQFEGMADPWAAHPAARAILDEASSSMGRDVVAGCRDPAALATTEFVQPALLACDVAAFHVLEAEGVSFIGVAGHSLGEFAALVAAGVVPFGDALDLVVVRGAAMQRAGEERPGAMTALLGVGAEDAAALCEEARRDDVLVVANENSPAQSVISGSVSAIERAEALAKERKVRAIRLRVAGAFHSPLMEPARAAIDERIDAIDFSAPRLPVAENVVGALVSDPARAPVAREAARDLARQVGVVGASARRRRDHLVPRGRSRRRPHQADEADPARRGGARDRLAGGRARRRVGTGTLTAAMLRP